MRVLTAILLLLAAMPAHAADDIAALIAAAGKGDAQAQYKLGYDYHFGLGVKIDPRKALELWRKSSDQNNPHGQAILAVAYSNGWGVPEDPALALSLYEKAAAQGDAKAKFLLGTVYDLGFDNVTPDHDKAAQLWKEAIPGLRALAEKGDADAQCDLSTAYAKGRGVGKDEAEAFRWRMKAAEQGHPLGEIAVASSYHDGRGVPKDLAKAMIWLARAADHGAYLAQLELAKAYNDGGGVPKDRVQAYKWADLALVQGSTRAGPLLGTLARDMTPEQLKQARQLSHDWQVQHLAEVDDVP